VRGHGVRISGFSLLLLTCMMGARLAGRAGHGGGARSAEQITTACTGLCELDCTGSTSCDLHLVADDWSSGTWADRSGNYNAALTGSLTKTASSVFTGRSEISGFSAANYFSLSANTAHNFSGSVALTYEFITRYNNTTGPGGDLVGQYVSPYAGGYEIGPVTEFLAVAYNNAGSDYLFPIGATTLTDERYYLLTAVFDGTSGQSSVWVNGSLDGTDNTTNGSLAGPTLQPFVIGSAFGSVYPTTGAIVEVVRHRTALSGATIAARAAQFNALKGY